MVEQGLCELALNADANRKKGRMSRYVVETPEHSILGGSTHATRKAAMVDAQRLTDLPWEDLAEEGYRIRELVARMPPARGFCSFTGDLPKPH